jgi:exopolyphosphatase/guanosine-5'-triphosphate,3'-diphosphate pyrophosphatase
MARAVRVAAIDIGTNTIRLLVADVVGDALVAIERRAVVVGLGRGVDATRRISAEAMERAVARLEEFRVVAGPVDRIGAVATSATRDADNAAGFIAAAEAAIGARVRVIGGEEEAALSFAGAVRGIPGPAPTLVIDPGGGSTEFVLGDEAPVAATSVDIGSVRLTERLLPERPASAERIAAAAGAVADMFGAIDLGGEPARAIGVAGTYTAIAAIHLGLERYDGAAVHGTVMTVADLDGIVARLAPLTLADTDAIPSLEEGRAPVLLGGAIVAAEAVRRSGLAEVTISEADLLDGLARSLSR